MVSEVRRRSVVPIAPRLKFFADHELGQQMAFRIARISALLVPRIQQRVPICALRHYASVDKSNPTQSRKEFWDENMKALQAWQRSFKLNTFPRDLCSVTFSRSSGPGGQNVNK
jgi:hypothetical protein